MNYLLAYSGKTSIESLLSTENAIYDVCVENQTLYASTHNLRRDENEWFYIENFRASIFNTAIAKVGGTEIKIEELFVRLIELNDFESRDYSRIKWLITKQGEDYYFQKVTPSSRIQNKTVLYFWEGVPEIRKMDNSIEVHRDRPDIVYDAAADKLIFKDLSKAKVMFPMLEELCKEATEDEVKAFFSLRTDLSMPTSFDIGIRNRKSIARLLAKITGLSDQAKTILATYVTDHLDKAGLHTGDDGRIIISTATQLKGYLDLLDERFITSEIYEEDRKITAFILK